MADPEPPMKKQKVAAAVTAPGHVGTAPGEVANSSCSEASIRVRNMSGAILREMCIQHSLLGQHLLDAMLDLLPHTGHTGIGIWKLVHGIRCIDTSRPVLEQGVADGAELTLVWRRIALEQQHKVAEQVFQVRDRSMLGE